MRLVIKKLHSPILILVFLLSFGSISFLSAQAECANEQKNFNVGEKIVYQVFYHLGLFWLPAGEVAFEVSETDSSYVFDVTGISYPSYDSFFKVRDYYRSEISKEDLFPMRFRRNILEGDYTVYDSIEFKQEQRNLTEYISKQSRPMQTFEYDFQDQLHDLVSLAYHLRTVHHHKEKSDFQIELFFDQEFYQLHVDYLGVESKKIRNIGKVNCLHYSPQLIEGNIFDEDSKMHLWVSEDQNMIPVYLESPVIVGSVKVVLKSYSNLLHPSVVPCKS